MGATCGEIRFTEAAYRCLRAFSGQIVRYPAGFSWMLITLKFLLGKSREIVLYGTNEQADYMEMKSLLQHNYAPNIVVLYNEDTEALASFSPKATVMCGKDATAFVCEEAACRAAANTAKELKMILSES